MQLRLKFACLLVSVFSIGFGTLAISNQVAAQAVRGDFNNDGVVNLNDVQLFLPYLNTANLTYSLIGTDSKIDLYDYNELITIIGGSPGADSNFVSVQGDHFLLNGQQWYPYGTRYNPTYYTELSSEDFLSNPLTDARLQTIRQDLENIKNLRMNTISLIVWDDSALVLSNLHAFLNIAKEKNLRVALMLTNCGISLRQNISIINEAKCSNLLNAVKNNPTVWVIETSWEEQLGSTTSLISLNPAWQQWLVNNYGSLSAANTVLGTNWTSAKAPSLDQLCATRVNGSYKLATNYKRFLFEYAAKLHTANYVFVKKHDSHHLVSARAHGGNTGWRPECEMIPISPLAQSPGHDFISTQFYQVNLDPAKIRLRALVTADYLHTGRPVIITEFGYSIFQPEKGGYFSSGLTEQKQYYEIVIPALKSAGIQGAFSWFYVGKRPWSSKDKEQSDLGIIEPNTNQRPGNAPRLAASVLRDQAPYIPSPRNVSAETIYMDYLKYPNFTEVFEETVAELSRDQTKNVRLEGTQYTSATVPVRCLTGDAISPCPQRNLSSALVLEVMDETGTWKTLTTGMTITYKDSIKIRGYVANTGETAWITQSPNDQGLVQIGYTGAREGRIPIQGSRTPGFQKATVPEHIISLEGNTSKNLEFRTVAEGKAWFGEIIRVKLQQSN